MLGITNQGTVSTTGGIIFQTTNGYRAIVQHITITNTANLPFQLTLSLYRGATGTITQIYYFELSSGDLVYDEGVYELYTGDYLFADTNVSNTVYTMNGIQIDLSQEILT